jgi:pyridoxine/pyridoxamine 5'-phosphate oxidase
VLLKGCDERGMVWFTNYDSRKGRELAHPFAALQFHWVEMERVVRIEGRVEKTSDTESDEYFQSRPLDSRLGAWASPQSQVISSRAVLVANAAKAAAQHGLNPPRRRTGAATAWCRTATSSGRAAARACTTGCASAATIRATGCANACALSAIAHGSTHR